MRMKKNVFGHKKYFAIRDNFFPLAVFYNILEFYFGDSWLPVVIVLTLMITACAGLYYYRRSKGIKDTWPND